MRKRMLKTKKWHDKSASTCTPFSSFLISSPFLFFWYLKDMDWYNRTTSYVYDVTLVCSVMATLSSKGFWIGHLRNDVMGISKHPTGCHAWIKRVDILVYLSGGPPLECVTRQGSIRTFLSFGSHSTLGNDTKETKRDKNPLHLGQGTVTRNIVTRPKLDTHRAAHSSRVHSCPLVACHQKDVDVSNETKSPYYGCLE